MWLLPQAYFPIPVYVVPSNITQRVQPNTQVRGSFWGYPMGPTQYPVGTANEEGGVIA